MNSAWHGNEEIMAEKVDYGTLKKGGFMRQKQKNNFSLRLAVVGGYLQPRILPRLQKLQKNMETDMSILHQDRALRFHLLNLKI